MPTIAIGADHAGFPYKAAIKQALSDLGHTLVDHGTDSPESVDYPDFVHPVAEDVESGRAAMGVVLCGSGNGVAITANKHRGIRAALCWIEEIAVLARAHNDANVIAIPVRYTNEQQAVRMVTTFVQTAFDGGRHARRVGKMACAPSE